MDRNTIAGFVLIALIFIGWGYFTSPSEEEIAQYKYTQDSLARADSLLQATALKEIPVPQETASVALPRDGKDSSIVVLPDSVLANELFKKYGVFHLAAGKKSEFIELENDKIHIRVSTLGGQIQYAALKDFKRYDSLPLVLFEGDSNAFQLSFPTRDNLVINTGELHFVPVKGSPPGKLLLRLYAGSEDKYIEYEYSLETGSNLLGFNIRVVGMNGIIPGNASYLTADWKQNLNRLEKSMENERLATTCYFRFTDNEVDYLSETEDEKKSLPTKVKWIAFKQQFFSTVLIPGNELDKPISVETVTPGGNSDHVKYMTAGFSIPFNHSGNEVFPIRFYLGPNHFHTLKALDLGLEKLIPLGWGIFGWVNRYLVIQVFNFLEGFNLNYGIIILILSIVVKIVLLPLTYKAYLSQAKMKVLKPEMEEINAKHPKDPMKAQQETMNLYRRAGVNPLGGCLPLLLQLPILIAMFRFFPSSIELRQQGFLWTTDLSTYDSIYDFGFSVPFYGDHISLWTLLMTVSTIFYTLMNNQMFAGGNSAMQQQMKWMAYLMPVVFMGVLNNYSSGLSYYYFLANVTGFIQQYLFRAMVNEKAIHEKIQENKKKPLKKSGFQARLEEMAKQRGVKSPK